MPFKNKRSSFSISFLASTSDYRLCPKALKCFFTFVEPKGNSTTNGQKNPIENNTKIEVQVDVFVGQSVELCSVCRVSVKRPPRFHMHLGRYLPAHTVIKKVHVTYGFKCNRQYIGTTLQIDYADRLCRQISLVFWFEQKLFC